MLDLSQLRSDPEGVAHQLKKRGHSFDVLGFTGLEAQRKALQIQVEEWQSLRNSKSKMIGQLKAKGEDVGVIMEEVAQFSDKLKQAQTKLEQVQQSLLEMLENTPNLVHPSVPEGVSESENKEMSRWGRIPEFDFEVKDHVDLGENLDVLDFAAAGKITGSRFVVMYRELARLQRGLTQFMLDVHTQEHGYQEVYVPYLVNQASLKGTGQFSKFADHDVFSTQSEDDLYLIPTAEVPVTNLFRDQIISEKELPLQLVAHTPCFRREAGSYGRDTRGIIRQHQFEKVELVQIVHPSCSYDALEQLTQHAENILQKLDLAYRKVLLCTGDMGFSSAKTYDLEVWLPGQNTYREISSCSNFENFQGRRMKARFKNENQKTQFVHTLNGSGLAVGRTLLAIMENYQNADGSITVPEVLRDYCGGLSVIERKK